MFSEMIQYSRLEGSNNLAKAVEATEKKLEDKRTTAVELENMLKVTLRSAVADGLIGG
jgi:translation initiation factor 2B subunit (eIF-2B alpha/beta/delta family)